MNAKKILKMCESESLTYKEVYELLASYFIKKLNSSGLEFNIVHIPYLRATTTLQKIEKKPQLVEQDISNYLKELSKMIKNCSREKSTILNIHFIDKGRAWKPKDSIFYILCRQSLTQGCVKLEIGIGYSFEQRLNQPELATEESLKAMYLRVDDIVKAIRLVPFGE